MNTTPIICSGLELESVLASIRERGGFVASLETRIGKHNADYRVNYFERVAIPGCNSLARSPFGSVAAKAGAGSSRTPLRQLTACASENLATPGHFERVVDKTRATQVAYAGVNPAALNPINGTGKSPVEPSKALANVRPYLSPGKVRAGPLPSAQSDGSVTFPHQGETPVNPAAPEAVKGAVAPRNQVIQGVEIPRTPPLMQRSCVTSRPEGNGGADAVGVGLSIASRLAALQERLAAAGKIKRRQPREARIPYAD